MIPRNQDVFVSIIVPVYNTGKDALLRCHESLIGQTYPFLEIIYINDGSCAQTTQLLNSFIEDNVLVIHKENGGVSSARNIGLRVCSGEIITFVDSDDVLPPYAVEQAVSLFVANDYDAVMGFIHFSDNLSQDPAEIIPGYTKKLIEVEPEQLLSYHLQGSLPGPWLKSKTDNIKVGVLAHFVAREIALSCLFPEGVPMAEDVAWSVDMLSICKKTAIFDSCWYFYLQNPYSATCAFRPACAEEAVAAIYAIGNSLKNNNRFAFHSFDFLVRACGESNRAARFLAGNKDIKLAHAMKDVRSIFKNSAVKNFITTAQSEAKQFSFALAIKEMLCKTGLSVLVFRILGSR